MKPSDRRLFDALPVAAYLCDAQGVITRYNAAAAQLWGRAPLLRRDRWCGALRLLRKDGTLIPADACPLALLLREEGKPDECEVIVERPDGQQRRVLEHPRLIRDALGTIVGAISVLVDTTDSRRLPRVEAPPAAWGGESAQEGYLAMVGHDLRTALAPILLAATALEEDPALSPAGRENLGIIRRNVACESRVIDELLDFTRASLGRLHLECQPLDLDTVVDQACRAFRARAPRHATEIQRDSHTPAGFLIGDAARLKEVVICVLEWVADATGQEGRIVVRTEGPEDGRFTITISSIITAGARDAMLNALDAIHRGRGMQDALCRLGIGLLLAEMLVEVHKGALHAAAHGAQTTIRIDLPVCAPEPASIA